ncbi:MAG TPA: energy transducer TonB [Steroidobacteraceae bacterium]|nr:energy transducer TonB [Steroidobacteraceae bacterium]
MRRTELPLETPEDAGFAQVAKQLAGAQPVEVLALTPDASLLAILREAAGRDQRIWHATTREQTAELIMSGQVGVVIVDALAIDGDCPAYCDQLRFQFPDLVLVVAGTTEDQTELVKHITSGDVYRFLHKPVSPPRARHAIDAAMRRHIEGRTIAAADPVPEARPTRWPLYSGIATGVVIVAVIAGAVLLAGRDTTENAPLKPAAAPQPAVTVAAAPLEDGDERSEWLALARAAAAAGQLTATGGEGAADYYQRVLAKYPDDREAMAGLDGIADQLLTSAETALLEQRMDDAARDIEAARTVRPNNMRLAFLSAQLSKERERQLISAARDAAAAGGYAKAKTLLEKAGQGQRTPSPALQQARKELEQYRVGSNAESLLRSAGERMQQGKLVEPENDSAKSFVLAALAADPKNTEAQQLRRALADQTLQKGRAAIAKRDFAGAETWLKHAESLGANVRTARRDLQTARTSSARSEKQAQLVTLMNERITQAKLLEPAEDNAKYYWLQLKSADPANEQLQPALQSLGTRLTQQAQMEFLGNQHQAARATIGEAKALGYSSSELTRLESQVGAALERAAFEADVVLANTLARAKYVEPRYPSAALRKSQEGWVDMDFTVAADGSVQDITVRAASPVGVFEDAAVKSVSQWRYVPLKRNGRAIEQRARLRMRFTVED